MKIGIVAPLYVTTVWHKDFTNFTTRSIESKEHELILFPVENRINPEFYPFQYEHRPEVQLVKVDGGAPQSVAKAWNYGIQRARELACDYVLVVNTDIILKSNAIDRIVAFAEKSPCQTCETKGRYIVQELMEGSYVPMEKTCEVCNGSGKDNSIVMWTMGQFGLDPEKGINPMDYDAIKAELESSGEDENVSEHPNFSSFLVRGNFLEEMGKFDENIIPAYFEDNDMHARIALSNKKAVVYGGARFFHYGSRTVNSDEEFRNAMPPMFDKNRQYFISKWGVPNVGDVAEMRKVYWKHPYNEEDKPLSYWRGQ